MAVRNDFTAGEVLAAADLNDTFASKLPYSYGTATPTTTDSGFLWYDSNSTPAATKFWDGSAFVPFGGKILQVVRDTDASNRSTTSTTFVDVTGVSVTITPQKSDSAVLLVATGYAQAQWSTGDAGNGAFAITDNSNNAISGAEVVEFGSANITGTGTRNHYAPFAFVAYATPATTSAVTYKLRFKSASANTTIFCVGAGTTTQMFAIEVSA